MHPLSIAAIRQKFPNEWVLLADPVTANTEVLSGIVLSHHPDKRELTVLGRSLIGGHANYMVVFTGKLPRMHSLGILRTLKPETLAP